MGPTLINCLTIANLERNTDDKIVLKITVMSLLVTRNQNEIRLNKIWIHSFHQLFWSNSKPVKTVKMT